MQKSCGMTFLNAYKVYFKDISGESKIKTAIFLRTYNMNLKEYTLFNNILNQHFENIFQRLSFSVRFLK